MKLASKPGPAVHSGLQHASARVPGKSGGGAGFTALWRRHLSRFACAVYGHRVGANQPRCEFPKLYPGTIALGFKLMHYRNQPRLFLVPSPLPQSHARAVAVFIQEFDAGLCQRGDDLLAGCWTASKIAAGRFEALGGWD